MKQALFVIAQHYSNWLRCRSRELNQYYRKSAIGHHTSNPQARLATRRREISKTADSGTFAGGRSFREDLAYKHRNCRGHYRLDRRSYLLSAGHGTITASAPKTYSSL